MAKPYSMDLRERAMRRVAAGESAHSVAAVLKVSVSSIIKWAQRQRRTGSVAPGKMGGHRSLRVSGEHRTWLLARVAGDPNVTFAQSGKRAWRTGGHGLSWDGRALPAPRGPELQKNRSSG